ncbi:MAG: MmcQ/YjbR family DNA-binding protein [Bacteroidota bacterium]|nr:MmcQ/YjbR family DNA-binding protein [Bacteroidota bacterium]
MNIEEFREYCLLKKGVTEEFPFDNVTLVFKVMGKMFALTDIDNFESINLKCDPEKAVELREQYSAIIPGYHMNKKHWNTIIIDQSVPEKNLLSLIDHSYELVCSGLSKTQKANLAKIIK